MKFYSSDFLALFYVFKLRYDHLKFSKKIRCINESKQTLKGHIKISECPRRVYKGSN